MEPAPENEKSFIRSGLLFERRQGSVSVCERDFTHIGVVNAEIAVGALDTSSTVSGLQR